MIDGVCDRKFGIFAGFLFGFPSGPRPLRRPGARALGVGWAGLRAALVPGPLVQHSSQGSRSIGTFPSSALHRHDVLRGSDLRSLAVFLVCVRPVSFGQLCLLPFLRLLCSESRHGPPLNLPFICRHYFPFLPAAVIMVSSTPQHPLQNHTSSSTTGGLFGRGRGSQPGDGASQG